MLESVEGGGWIERTRPEETEPGAASVPRCCERSLCSARGLWGKGEDRNIRTVAEELQCNTRVVFFFSFLIGLYRFFPACTARHRVPFVRIHRDGRSWVTPADFSERLETAGPRRARGAGAQVRDGGEREAGRAGAEPGGGGGRGAERGRARPAPLRASRAAGPA